MGLFSSSRSNRQLDRLLAHDALEREEADRQLAEFLRRLATAFDEAPDGATESRHLAAMARAARDLAQGDDTESNLARGARPRRPLLAMKGRRTTLARNRPMLIGARLAAGALALCGATAALAVAGVTLPGPARDVAAAVGLPNQAEENARADENSKASEALDAVRAEQARSQRRGEGKPDSSGDGDGVSTQSHTEGHEFGETISGRAKAEDGAREMRQDFGNFVREEADNLAEEKSGRTLPIEPNSQPNSQFGGPQTGETQSESGRQTGETMSQGGASIGEQAAGEHRP